MPGTFAVNTAVEAVERQDVARTFDLAVRRLADDLVYGADASRFVGRGNQFAQARAFAPGDDIRSIHWRLTARTGRLHTKEFESLRRTPIVILFDTSSSMDAASTPVTKRALGAWIAGAIGLIGRQRLSPVGLLCCGERAGRFMPSLSASSGARWLEEIRRVRPNERTILARTCDEAGAMFARMAVMVVISDLHDPDAPDALRRLAVRHDCVVIRLEDPCEAGRLRAGFLRAREAETGCRFVASSASRFYGSAPQLAFEALAATGVDSISLRTDEDFAPRLRRFLRDRGGLWRRAR